MQVARLLMDTSVSQFYPTIFISVTEVLDMLGNLVWDRIKRKAEYSDDGTLICSLAGINLYLFYDFHTSLLSFLCFSSN